MASIKNLKKEISYVLGELIDAVTIWEVATSKEQSANAVIEEIITTYNLYTKKINDRPTQGQGAYFKILRKDFEKEVNDLVEKINSLN